MWEQLGNRLMQRGERDKRGLDYVCTMKPFQSKYMEKLLLSNSAPRSKAVMLSGLKGLESLCRPACSD